jgi:photosystem II stability/assembly factor-like uncharacterized protein
MEQKNYKKVEQNYSLISNYLKMLMLILLSITIGSCGSIDKPDEIPEYFFWEPISILPSATWLVAVANNGDIWAVNHKFSGISLDANHAVDDVNITIVYLSTDNGKTWTKKFSLPFFGEGAIVINPVNGYIFVTNNMWLYRSTDRGENWVRIANVLSINDIVITPSGEIYMGTSENIHYSTDNGDTWVERNKSLPFASNQNYSLTLGTDSTLYAWSDRYEPKGVYRSTDGGDTWLPSSNYTDVYIRGLTISDDGSIFATAYYNAGVLKSTDGGVTWIQANTYLGVELDNKIIYNSVTRDIFVSDLYNSWIFRSTDLGASWESKSAGLPSLAIIYNFAFNPITGQMYIATSYGVYKSR